MNFYLKVKTECLEQLPDLGFRKAKRYYLHNTQNLKVSIETGEIGVSGGPAYALRVPAVLMQLIQNDMVEVY